MHGLAVYENKKTEKDGGKVINATASGILQPAAAFRTGTVLHWYENKISLTRHRYPLWMPVFICRMVL